MGTELKTEQAQKVSQDTIRQLNLLQMSAQELTDYMTHNAIVCWTRGIDKSSYPEIFFNYDWTVPYTGFYKYYQPQVSGATLIEAMTRLH